MLLHVITAEDTIANENRSLINILNVDLKQRSMLTKWY